MNRFFRLIKGSFGCVALVANVLFFCTAFFPVSLVKFGLPLAAVRRVCDHALNWLAFRWISVNEAIMAIVGRTRWDVAGLEGLNPRGWYLVSSNHQSWADILVLQKVFRGRIPFLKFFLKAELIWVPVIGLAWWALDFPFMKRGKGSGRSDLETTRRACEKFKLIPTSVINFVEGTRFTREKHDRQGSIYRHLLKPKAGGMAVALATMGEDFDALLDVTIAYPEGTPSFWDLLSGGMKSVVVRVHTRPIPPELVGGDYSADAAHRARIQEWLGGIWRDKDAELDALLPPAAQAARRT